MTKADEIIRPSSCLNKAKLSERIFVLHEWDAAMPHTIRAWAVKRMELGKNQPGDAQITEALQLASDIEDGLCSRSCGDTHCG